MAQPEHNLQTKLVGFVRDCVAADHEFWANDRSRKQSQFQHVREKARGIRRGVADTTLAVVGMVEIYIELKWPPNTPTEDQEKFGVAVQRIGRKWYWANSVERFRQCLVDAGVPLRPNAWLVAANLDALLAGRQAKSANLLPKRKRKSSGKPRQAEPTASGLKFGRARDRLGGLF
jgi:hypothetical protein